MNPHPENLKDPWETDKVWQLLDQSPPISASPRFATDVVRAARLSDQSPLPWWNRLIATPASLITAGVAVAALILAAIMFVGQPKAPMIPSTASVPDNTAEIQAVAEIETLAAAVDELDRFSDTELVTLIGF